jgi:hypothetical protein
MFHAGWDKSKRWIWRQGKAQTTAIPAGIARICNAALAPKTRFDVPDRVKFCTRCRAFRPFV